MKLYTRSTAAGAWVPRDVAPDSIVITDAVNERSTATATILDSTGALRFAEGESVKVDRGGEQTVTYAGSSVTYGGEAVTRAGMMFRGFILTATEARLGTGGTRRHEIDAVDLHYLTDKRIVVDAYQGETAGAIVTDLLTTHLAGEGLTAGLIQDGPTIRAITFDYVTVADAITDLAQRAGFWWRIRPDGTLDFAEPIDLITLYAGSENVLAGDASINAGATGTTSSETDVSVAALADSIDVKRHAAGYRNRQWIRGGRDKTVTQIEIQYGDGERRAFPVGFPIAQEPTIDVSLNGGAWTSQTVGVAGLQTGAWQWSRGSPTIQHHSNEPILGPNDRVRVTYTGLFDVIVKVDDEPEQNDRASIEGGSGLVERVLTNAASDSREEAIQLAGELLEYWTPDAVTIRFSTRSTSFEPGQTGRFTLDEASLNAETALVTTVEHFTFGGEERQVVTLVVGPQEGSWAQWFGHLSRRIDRQYEPRGGEAEVVTTLEPFSKTWTEAERPNIFTVWQPGVGTTVGPGDVVAAFEPSDRVLYLAWFKDGLELGRKAFTTQTGADSSEIFTTTILVTTDAVGDIDELAWFGGAQASTERGSGVEVDRQAFVETKTDIEQIQVEKTDTKWS